MTDLQKEFEATGYASWVNSDLYPDGKAYTNEYVMWLENKIAQQRTEGIREGFEAARVVKSHNIDGDKERVDAILALWNNSLAEYPTADDYLNQK